MTFRINLVFTITSSEVIQTPDIWIAGQNATETGSGTSWSGAYTMASNSEGPVSLIVDFSDLAGNAGTRVTSTTDNATSVLFDRTSPILDEITPVPTPTSDNESYYTFSSDEAGTIAYGGSCSSSTSAASASNNTIDFNTLSVASYGDCTIRVTDGSGNLSNLLMISSFTIETTPPTVFSFYPTDNLSGISISTDNISVTFSESMDNTSVTSNTSNTSCSGSIQLSSDNFASCVQMGSSPTISNSNQTFTVAPSLTMFYSMNYKIRITTTASDIAGNTMASNLSLIHI